MMKSLYSGVSGLKTHNQRMDVIGNNIANVNTTAYKASAVTFKDVYYQTKQQASAGDATSGGTNPRQVGYGVSMGTINQVMTQSGLTYSDSIFDCALVGEGFFQVMDPAGNIYYSRNGVFDLDNAGNLVDANKNIVLGVSGDPTGVAASSQRISIYVPDVQNNIASATKPVREDYSVTISAAEYGPNGNIAIKMSNSEIPFATLNGANLNVQVNFNQIMEELLTGEYNGTAIDDNNYKDVYQQALTNAVNNAIREGGVNLPDGVVPLNISFDFMPPLANLDAVQASNAMELIPIGGSPFYLNFTADQAGEFANKYQINVKPSTSATNVTVKWSNDNLTITVPSGKDKDGNPYEFSLEDIQKAIYKSLNLNDEEVDNIIAMDEEALKVYMKENPEIAKKMIKVSVFTLNDDGEREDASFDSEGLISALGTNTRQLGMTGGAENFFTDVATAFSNTKLEGGRYYATQTHSELSLISIDTDGTIYGEHPVHGKLLLGRIDVVTFENPGGLLQSGTSYWKASNASGAAQVKIAGEDGAAEVVSGSTEMSNVDLSQEFSDMIITQRGFQANSRIITVSDTMLEELINLKR